MKNSLRKIKKLFPVLIVIGVFVFYISTSNAEDNMLNGAVEPDRSSVTFPDGNYHVDSAVIRKDLNKNRLISSVEKETLSDKKTKIEIPAFIWDFLNGISCEKKFDIVNPGEDWKSGITNYGHIVYTKVYDSVKQDSVVMMSGDGAILPNKQLVYFGISDNMALMSYFRGGFGPLENVIIMKLQNSKVIDFWYGSVYEGSVANKKDIIKSLLTKSNRGGC